MPPKKTGKRRNIKTWITAIVILLLVALVAGRVYLPHWLTSYVNRQIAALEGYSGSVNDIDVHLWRGAYTIHGLDIRKTQGGLEEPFVAAHDIDLSVEWKALLHGTVVAEIEIRDIALSFAKSQSGKGADWTTFINNLMPFDINRLAVEGGKIAYLDYAASPDVNIYIEDISLEVTNLRNVGDEKVALPSGLRVSGRSIGNGKLGMTGEGNILKQVPDFDLDIRLEDANLSAFNDYTREAAAIDFASGTISVYSEMAAVDGRVTGYVKPIATKVEMISTEQDNPLNALWESLAATFVQIFKNHERDQFALRIPIEGRLENPEGNAWSGFWSIFENAFGKAFPRRTDGTLNFQHALDSYRVED